MHIANTVHDVDVVVDVVFITTNIKKSFHDNNSSLLLLTVSASSR